MVACLCKAKEPDVSFKPEYIISQLLLQYVSQEYVRMAGIQYPSTKIDYRNLQNIRPYNYVFPVKSNNREGFCNWLVRGFHLTMPIKLPLNKTSSGYNSSTLIQMNSATYQASCFGEGEATLKTSATEMVKD